jgi:preprotein translocase subunit YajC
MQESLKKNDRVVTIGGILGVVVNTQAGSDKVTIRIDESNGTRMEVLRSAISRVVNADSADSAKTEA